MQNTVDGEDDFIRDIISPSAVNKTDETQAIPEFAHASPFFYDFFLKFPCLVGSLHGFNLTRVRQHLRK